MKIRLFFIVVLIVSMGIGITYTVEFFSQYPFAYDRLSPPFIGLLLLAVIMQLLAHYIRAYKSRYLLDTIRKSPTKTLFKGLSVGFLFNTLLPLRLGELIRAFYIGDALYISKTTAFVTIIIERIADGFILGSAFLVTGLLVKESTTSGLISITSIGVSVLSVTAALIIFINIVRTENRWLLRSVHRLTSVFNESIRNRLRFMAWSGIYGTRLILGNRPAMKRYVYWSVGMWLLYLGSAAAVAAAFFGLLSPGKLWFTTQSVFAGVSAPAGPGYVGSFHLIVARLLGGIGLADVGSFTLTVWLVMIAPISIAGLYVLARQRFGEKRSIPKQQLLINKLHRERDISEEFGHFLDAYLKGERINHLLTKAELDDKFNLIKSFKGGSNAHTMLVWQEDGLRVKKITLLQYAEKLEDQANWLLEREHLNHLPKVVAQEKTEHYYTFDLAYREDFYPFFAYIHTHATPANFSVLKRMLRFMNKSIYDEAPVEDGDDKLREYIDDKILGKVNDTAAVSGAINRLLSSPKITVNGASYDNMPQVIEKIRRNKRAMRELADYKETPIHGDLTVDNLITSAKGDFLVIDPNNENKVSSRVVDFSKMYQSLHSGYEFLIQLETCQLKGTSLRFEDARSQKYAELFVHFDAMLKDELDPRDYRSLLFHEAVHYCRMLTYRANINPKTVPVFYATAVKLFNEFIAQYD